MIKKWLVKCQVNMDASREVSVIVKANTERKAKAKAISECHHNKYFHVTVLSCKEMDKEGE